MTYCIDISFDFLRYGGDSHSALLEQLKQLADDSHCVFSTLDAPLYECDVNVRGHGRLHNCIITLLLEEEHVASFLSQLKEKTLPGVYVESVYNERTHSLIYVSSHYKKQCMSLDAVEMYQAGNNRSRSWSDLDRVIRSLLLRRPSS